MRKLSKINEGMFKASIQRSNSNKVRKEDNVNRLCVNDFVTYINDNYTLRTKAFGRPSSWNRKNGLLNISVCIWWIGLSDVVCAKIVYDKDDKAITDFFLYGYPKKLFEKNEGLYDLLSKDYIIGKLDDDEMHIKSKDDIMNNQWCLNFINDIINNIEYPAIIKNEKTK